MRKLFLARLVCTLLLFISCARAQYDTFAERQQAVIQGVLNSRETLDNPDQTSFWAAEVLFQAANESTGTVAAGDNAAALAQVNGILNRIEGPGWNSAGRLQCMISGIDCYLRFGRQWDAATRASFRNYYTTTTVYAGQTTSNLTMLAAVTRYLGGQTFLESAYPHSSATSANSDYSATDPTGSGLISGRIASEVRMGVQEFASRPYTVYDVYPLLVLSQFCADPALKNQAAICYELWLAQSAATWLHGSWAVSTARSYPDVLVQSPSESAELLWLYFGGLAPVLDQTNQAVGAAIAGYQPPPEIVAAATARNSSYVAQSAFGNSPGFYQTTYMTPNYAVFSQGVSPGTTIPNQVYPNGVMWNDSALDHTNFLWVTDPEQDLLSNTIHTHGINSRSVQWLQDKGTFVMVRTLAQSSDTYPYLLGYVPGGYQAMINDSANGRIYLYYNDSVMVAISSFQPFKWDPNAGIAFPTGSANPGDSQFHIPAVTFQAGSTTYDQAGLALETAAPSDFLGNTPAQRLAAFQTALQHFPLPALTLGVNPTILYQDHQQENLRETYDETGTIDGKPINYASTWPMIENPFVTQPLNGNVTVSLGNQQTTYDLTKWTITRSAVQTPPVPTNAVAIRANGSVLLTWSASASATSYSVSRSNQVAGPYTPVASNIATTQWTDYGLVDDTTYYYQITAQNRVGASPASSTLAITPGLAGLLGSYYGNSTEAQPVGFTRIDPTIDFDWPSTPGGNLSASNLSVHWVGTIVAPTTADYKFFLTSHNGSKLTIDGTKVLDEGGNHPTATGTVTMMLVGGQPYPIIIDYQNGSEAGLVQFSWSSPSFAERIVSAEDLYPPAPTPPSGLSALVNNGSIVLSWVGSANATTYAINRSTSATGTFAQIGTSLTSTYVDQVAVPGTTYFYKVLALNSGGTSSPSTSISASVVAPASVSFADWEKRFGASNDPTATPFPDQTPDLLKYIFDIDPTRPMTLSDRAALPLVGGWRSPAGQQYLTLTFRQNASLAPNAYSFQFSGNLTTWTTLSQTSSPSYTLTQVGTDSVTSDPVLEVMVPTSATRAFIRLDAAVP